MESVSNHKMLLKNKGLKITTERLSVLSVLEKASKPLSIKEVNTKLLHKNIDQATVYRTIDALVKTDIVRMVNFQHGHNHYELNTKKHHHHLICEKCGKVVDISECITPSMESKIKKMGGFSKINNHAIEFFGICKQCAKP